MGSLVMTSLVMTGNVTMGAAANVWQHPLFFCGDKGMAKEVLVKIDGEVCLLYTSDAADE